MTERERSADGPVVEKDSVSDLELPQDDPGPEGGAPPTMTQNQTGCNS